MRKAGLGALLVLAVFVAAPANARIQGAKGRRLEVIRSRMPYKGGELILEPATIDTSWSQSRESRGRKVVTEEGIRRYADQFLRTRLRVLPLTVRVSPPRASLPPQVGTPTLRGSPHVLYQASGKRLLVAVDFVDANSGELVASYTGHGHGRFFEGEWISARDDMQEISRLLVEQLSSALMMSPPAPWGPHYQPDPYRRRPGHGTLAPAAVTHPTSPAVPMPSGGHRDTRHVDKDKDTPSGHRRPSSELRKR